MEFAGQCGRMYYEECGESERALLLLHGWGASGENWLPVSRDFMSEYRVYTVDFPGFGKSPEPDGAWSVDEYMELTARFIREVIKGKCDIMAHSFGGRVAVLLASEYPELTGKLVLTGCAGLLPKRTAFQKLKRLAFRLITRVADNRLTRAALGEDRINKARDAARVKFGSSDYKAASPRMREILQNVLERDLKAYLARIKSPALLVWGDADTATPVWMGRVMEAEIPDAGLVVFEGAGHFAYLEMYPRFKIVARKFLLG